VRASVHLTSTEKKSRLLRAYLAGYPVWCAWQVTYRCNFRCAFCHYWKDPQGQVPEQSVGQFHEGARRLARIGSMLISLAGGEPLLRDDIVQVARAVATFHLPFITTNGYLATAELARELFQAGLWGVSISLDYADAAQHDRRRGVKGAFERAVQAIEYFARARRHRWQRVNVIAVLMHDNADQLEELAKLAASFSAYFMVQPYCPLKTGDERFICSEQGVAERMLQLRRRHANVLSNPYFLSKFDQALNGGVPGCLAGKAFFNIDSVGDLAVCVERRHRPVGNLYRDDILAVLRKMRRICESNTCRSCWYNCRGEVESLYKPYGLFRSLPTFLFDRGKSPEKPPIW